MAHANGATCLCSMSLKLTITALISFNFCVISVLGLAGAPAAIDVSQYDTGNYLMPKAQNARKLASFAKATTRTQQSPASPIVSNGQRPQRNVGLKAHAFKSKPVAAKPRNVHAMAAATDSSPTPITLGQESDHNMFMGLSQLNQLEAAMNTAGPLYAGNQTVQEPANVGLAIGGGYIIQVVSSAILVTDTSGRALTATTELLQFFNLQSGDLLLNARTLYDASVGRFYVTVSGINNANVYPSRFPDLSSYQLIAVSKSRNPLSGFYYYVYDTSLPAGYHMFFGYDLCPCYASVQSLGFSADALLISGDAASLEDNSFAGAIIQAISKSQLVSGKAAVKGVRFDGDTAQFSGYLTQGSAYVDPDSGDVVGKAFSVQPAHLPPLFTKSTDKPAAAFFLSTDVWSATSGSTIELWALTKTSSLGNNPTAVKLSQVTIPVDGYSYPPAGIQESGPAPLGALYEAPLEQINTGDDRMHQVVYANGLLLGAFATATEDASGIFYVAIKPSVDASGAVTGTVVGSGTIAIPGVFLAYPAISANRKRAAIVYTASSSSMFPSVAYSYIDLTTFTVTSAMTVFAGKEPVDGYTGYENAGYPVTPGVQPSPPVNSFGQYSAAVMDGDSTFWVAAETTPGGSRDASANWGTIVAKLKA